MVVERKIEETNGVDDTRIGEKMKLDTGVAVVGQEKETKATMFIVCVFCCVCVYLCVCVCVYVCMCDIERVWCLWPRHLVSMKEKDIQERRQFNRQFQNRLKKNKMEIRILFIFTFSCLLLSR